MNNYSRCPYCEAQGYKKLLGYIYDCGTTVDIFDTLGHTSKITQSTKCYSICAEHEISRLIKENDKLKTEIDQLNRELRIEKLAHEYIVSGLMENKDES